MRLIKPRRAMPRRAFSLRRFFETASARGALRYLTAPLEPFVKWP